MDQVHQETEWEALLWQSSNHRMFLERSASRVSIAGWKLINNIKGKDLHMLYGSILIKDCREEAKSYLKLDSVDNW